jgi:hypothetical protein
MIQSELNISIDNIKSNTEDNLSDNTNIEETYDKN